MPDPGRHSSDGAESVLYSSNTGGSFKKDSRAKRCLSMKMMKRRRIKLLCLKIFLKSAVPRVPSETALSLRPRLSDHRHPGSKEQHDQQDYWTGLAPSLQFSDSSEEPDRKGRLSSTAHYQITKTLPISGSWLLTLCSRPLTAPQPGRCCEVELEEAG